MAIVEWEFRNVVLAVPAVVALIEDRLRPIILKPNEVLPAATYSRTSTRYDTDVDDAATEYPTMELTLWGFDYLAMKEAVLAVKDAMRTGNHPAPLSAITVTGEDDVFDDRFQHADGIGVPGVRLECQLIVL